MPSAEPSSLPRWQDIIARVIGFRSSDEDAEIDYGQLVGEELTTMAGTVKKAIIAKMAELMAAEERTSIEAAGVLVTWKPKKSTRVVDLEAYWDYMRKHPELLPAAFNPNDMRKTGIPQTVFDTFFEEVPGVSPVIGLAPMWIIEMLRNKKLRQTGESNG